MELQAAGPKPQEAPGESERGYTRPELEQVAAELGISPEAVRAALDEHRARASAGSRWRLWPGPTRLTLERVVPGVVTDDTWAEMVEEIRSALDETGRTERIGKALQWSDRHGTARVTVTPLDGGRTRIRVHWRAGPASAPFIVLPLYVTLASCALIVDGLHYAAGLEASIAAGIIAVNAVLTRAGFAGWLRGRREKMAALLARLQEIVVGSPAP